MDRANSHTYRERTPMFRSVLFTSAQICTNNAPEPIRETRDDVSADGDGVMGAPECGADHPGDSVLAGKLLATSISTLGRSIRFRLRVLLFPEQ